MIEFRNVSKGYPIKHGYKHILQNFSFKFPEDINIGILGRNGVGKSTIMRLIAQSEFPDSGTIVRKGKFSWPLGFAGGFSPSLTGEENLRFICRIYDADILEVTRFVKDFSELGAFFYEPIGIYSNGMKARLSFALSMAIDFDVVLIDEILGVGDQSFQKKCHKKVNEKAEKSKIIMVTHNMVTIKNFCKIVVLIDDGKLKIYTDIDEAINVYKES